MRKSQFLFSLRDRLDDLPQAEVEERLNFYSEMIDDRVEEGLSEEEAVAAVGAVDRVAAQILEETPPEKEKASKRKFKAWEITLLVLGSPLWVSLLIAAVAVVFSVYISVWSVIVSLWAVFGSMIACAVGVILGGIVMAVMGSGITGVALVGAGIVCGGMAIFLYYGCKAVTKGVCLLTKKVFTRRGAK